MVEMKVLLVKRMRLYFLHPRVHWEKHFQPRVALIYRL